MRVRPPACRYVPNSLMRVSSRGAVLVGADFNTDAGESDWPPRESMPDRGSPEIAMNDAASDEDALRQVPWLTGYDRAHLTVYSSLLAAERNGRDWRETARLLLNLDVEIDETAAKAVWDAHLQRARWFWT